MTARSSSAGGVAGIQTHRIECNPRSVRVTQRCIADLLPVHGVPLHAQANANPGRLSILFLLIVLLLLLLLSQLYASVRSSCHTFLGADGQCLLFLADGTVHLDSRCALRNAKWQLETDGVASRVHPVGNITLCLTKGFYYVHVDRCDVHRDKDQQWLIAGDRIRKAYEPNMCLAVSKLSSVKDWLRGQTHTHHRLVTADCSITSDSQYFENHVLLFG